MQNIKIYILFIVFSSISAWGINIKTWKNNYTIKEDIWIQLYHTSENEKDWIGIFKAGSSNTWENIISLKRIKNVPSQGKWYKFSNLKAGTYEARFFLNNSFKVKVKVKFNVGNTAYDILTRKTTYDINESIWIKLRNKPGNEKDWIGIYKAGAISNYANIISNNSKRKKMWVYTSEISETDGLDDWYKFTGLNKGSYEARLFLNDSYDVEKTVKFHVADDVYGKKGNYYVSRIDDVNNMVLYHPNNWRIHPTPVLFFLPAAYQTDSLSYDTLLQFMASHGYSVIFVPAIGSYQSKLVNINNMIKKYADKLDTSKIGIVGHAAGGGFTFRLLEYMIKKGYGSSNHGVNYRFLFSMDGVYAQYMNKRNMRALRNTNIVLMQFQSSENNIDPRMVLTNYDLLTGENIDKNYIVLSEDEDHNSPKRQDIDSMQGMLKPLDALMRYTFEEPKEPYHEIALEGKGKVDPYMNVYQKVLSIDSYRLTCRDANTMHIGASSINKSDINNCGEPVIMPNNKF